MVLLLVFMQLTRDLFAIAKFLCMCLLILLLLTTVLFIADPVVPIETRGVTVAAVVIHEGSHAGQERTGAAVTFSSHASPQLTESLLYLYKTQQLCIPL